MQVPAARPPCIGGGSKGQGGRAGTCRGVTWVSLARTQGWKTSGVSKVEREGKKLSAAQESTCEIARPALLAENCPNLL